MVDVLFTYDRPHWKTERFIHELMSLGRKPDMIVGTPWRVLDLPPAVCTTVKHLPRHPAELAARYGIRYVVGHHEELLDCQDLSIGVIAGARILPRCVIDLFSIGIINLHPGVIPENRGLQNMARAFRDDLPQAITAHLIDERIDAGRPLMICPVEVEEDDTVYDLGERMMDTQVRMLETAIDNAELDPLPTPFPHPLGGYEPPMPITMERAIFDAWDVRQRAAR